MTVRSFLVCLLAAVAMLSAAWRTAAAGGFRLELNLRAQDDSRPYLYQAEVTRAEADDLALGGGAQQKYLREAQKGYADKKGYREAIYGPEFWKIVRIADWDWKVIDSASGRTVSSGGKRRGGGAGSL